jgi:hypothetical protein
MLMLVLLGGTGGGHLVFKLREPMAPMLFIRAEVLYVCYRWWR